MVEEKSAVVLTTSAVAVEQWRKQFEEYTSVVPDRLLALTAEVKQQLWPVESAGILISTYTMLAFSGKRSAAAQQILNQIKEREWGLLIFDEVQFAPAPAFRRINDLVRAHCRLGLTATLVREDDLIKDLQWIIGPKLYEANWIDLQNQGFLAKVSCQEVWCPMTAEFYREYLRVPHAKQRKLWVCNPTKLMVCEFLMRYHESRGDKVIVFSDNVFALLHAARALNRPFIYGQVSPPERMAILSKFRNESSFSTLFLSKVGDNAIDIPCANVVIQISFNFASRRQEAQRLGRILRAKPRGAEEEGGFNAYFYSLISKDTLEMVYADKRQQFIIDQGYSYKVLHCRDLPLDPQSLVYGDRERQLQVLRDIMLTDDSDRTLDDDEDEGAYLPMQQQQDQQQQQQPTGSTRVVQGGLAGLSGFEVAQRGGRGAFCCSLLLQFAATVCGCSLLLQPCCCSVLLQRVSTTCCCSVVLVLLAAAACFGLRAAACCTAGYALCPAACCSVLLQFAQLLQLQQEEIAAAGGVAAAATAAATVAAAAAAAAVVGIEAATKGTKKFNLEASPARFEDCLQQQQRDGHQQQQSSSKTSSSSIRETSSSSSSSNR
ncbi:hypothetical protein Emed_004649 [Eimeria media]